MADDIDIEEHDVLDNPLIKSIFPDLSILKKEFFDDDDYEGYYSDENVKKVDEQHNLTAIVENNIITNIAPAVDEGFPLNHCNSFDDKNSDYEEPSRVIKSNRIILGSKPNKTGNNGGNCGRNIFSATVQLKDISPYLDCCKKYCQICLILFPSKEALNVHIHQCHFVQDSDRIMLNNISELNIENNTELLNMNKPKCNICHKHFATTKTLNKHRRSIHFIFIRPSRIKHKTIKEKKILKAANTNLKDKQPNNAANSCFHCKNIFPNMQCLIEHLYDILQTKNESKDVDNARESLNKLKLYKKDAIDNAMLPQISEEKTYIRRKGFSANLKKYFYRCPICFYYYNNGKCISDHLLNKHKFVRKAPLKKVLFEPKCKFCLSEFKTLKRYNAHISKVHKKMFLRKSGFSTKPMQNVINCKENKLIKNNIAPETKPANEAINEVYDRESFPAVGTNIGIFKSALFRCVRCDIHFMNSHTAIDHTNHMEILINWKCTLCNRIFKNIDEHKHRQQHLESNDFTVYGISESTIVIYQCFKCNTHYEENTYVQHYPVCGKNSMNHVKCKTCGIFIDNKIYKVHNNYHKKKSNETSDIMIIKAEVLQDGNVDENMVNKKELRTRNVMADADADKIQDFKNNHFFTVYYCHTCKCFVNDTQLAYHKKALCNGIVPTTCKQCGLVITRSSLSSHGRLHLKKKDLALKDFKFRDLKSNKPITPPIPDFPRCSGCGIYFASLITKIRHECGVVEFITCHDCGKDFSKLGHKLHMTYHDYLLSSYKMCKKLSPSALSKINAADTSDVETVTPNLVGKAEKFIIFTCKNCDISLDTYDLTVEHCQGHYNPVANSLPPKICQTCKLKFSAECFESHKKIHEHKNYSISTIFVKFDLFYFTSDYKTWMKRVFIFLPSDLKEDVINKSIYKYENRIKLRIIQEGPIASTVYKCNECRCFIDPSSLYKHLGNNCTELRKHLCGTCDMPFISISCKLQHELVHLKPFKGLKSYRIVLFNKAEDRVLNEALQNSEIWFTLYKCRKCGGIISRESETDHLCDKRYLKKCSHCGLLFYRKELKLHLSKHKQVKTFKGENIKVILIGSKIEIENCETKMDGVSMFKGKVCDYLLFKCKSCQVCLCDPESVQIHFCTNLIPMKNCSQCGLYLEAKIFDDHCIQHETDCDFVSENITIIEFDNTPLTKVDSCKESTSYAICENGESTINVKEESSKEKNVEVLVKSAKLYKCPCGLHFIDKSYTSHLYYCKSKKRISRQQCSKCGLEFSPNVLFKHLLCHHGNKNVSYTFDITDIYDK